LQSTLPPLVAVAVPTWPPLLLRGLTMASISATSGQRE